MLIPAIVFVAVALVVLVAYYALIGRPEGKTQRALARRFTPAPSEPFDETVGLLKESERLSDVPALDYLLGALTTIAVPLQRWLSQSGLRWTVGTLLLLSGCAALLAFMIAAEVVGSALVGVPLAVGAAYAPFAWVQYKRARRLQLFEEQFPEAIDLLARSLRAGHAFTTGLEMVGAEMDDPVGAEFRQMFDSQTFGMPVPDTLRHFAERTPLIDAKFFATAVLTQRDAGGNLSEVLDNLSSVIRERFRVKRQVRVVTADKRATGWVLCALPPSIAVALFILNPRQFMILVNDPLGVKMIAFAVTLQIVGTLIIRKMVRIETDMPWDVLVTLVGVFVGVALVAGSMASLTLGLLSPERRRLNELVGAGAAETVPLVAPATLTERPDASLERAARWLQKSPKDLNRLRRRMSLAGYRSYEAALVYSVMELVLPVIGFSGVIYFVGVSGGLAFAMLAAAIGYFAPSLWLMRRIEARKRQIRNGLPDALDLFIVCVESGSSLDQAILKAGEDLTLAHPPLAEELRVLATEIRAGKARLDAFRDFGERTKIDDVRALVAMLVQTDRFGTSIAQALRTHADTSRTKRRQRAEERAAKLGVKLVFPLVLCLFPAFYVVTIGPAIVQFLRVFVQGTAGK